MLKAEEKANMVRTTNESRADGMDAAVAVDGGRNGSDGRRAAAVEDSTTIAKDGVHSLADDAPNFDGGGLGY